MLTTVAEPVCKRLSTGSSVRVAGKWIGSRPGTAQQNELQAEEVQLLGAADPEVCSPHFSRRAHCVLTIGN